MFKYFALRALRKFRDHYDYDAGYLEHMLKVSPSAFVKFSKIMSVSRHYGTVPKEAIHAAKLVATIAEDCGPCVQLGVKMAREAGVDASQIKAVLMRDSKAMNKDTRLGFQFAERVVHGIPDVHQIRDDVRMAWGEAAVVDLSLALQIVRMFPMMKTALGFGETCQCVQLDDRPITVVKDAA